MLGSIKNRLASMRAAPVPVNDLLTSVDDHREVIASLKAERDRVARSPRPAAEIMTALDAWLDQAATDAVDSMRLGALLRRDRPIALDLPTYRDPVAGQLDVTPSTKALLGLLVAVNRQAFREIVKGQVEDLTRDRPGLTDEALSARLAEIDAEILAAEMAEESAIRSLAVAGVAVQRRADASPLAVLAHASALPST